MSKRSFSQSNQQVIAYIRVSSKPQSKVLEGHLGTQVQVKECKRYARKNGLIITKYIKEVSSARHMRNQKSLIKLISKYQNAIIIVFNISRFSRNTSDGCLLLEQMNQKDLHLVSATEAFDSRTIAGKHAIRTLLSTAELESDTISNRVKQSVQYRKSLGGYVGSAPYGYRLKNTRVRCPTNNVKVQVKRLVLDKHESNVKRFIRYARNGNISAADLSKHMYKIVEDRADRVPIVIEDVHSNRTFDHLKRKRLPFSDIAFLLNEYNVTKQGDLWTKKTVKYVYDMKYKKLGLVNTPNELIENTSNDDSDVSCEFDEESSGENEDYDELLNKLSGRYKKMKL